MEDIIAHLSELSGAHQPVLRKIEGLKCRALRAEGNNLVRVRHEHPRPFSDYPFYWFNCRDRHNALLLYAEDYRKPEMEKL